MEGGEGRSEIIREGGRKGLRDGEMAREIQREGRESDGKGKRDGGKEGRWRCE